MTSASHSKGEDVEAIAFSLTEEQRQAVKNCRENWQRLYGTGTGAYKGASVRRLIEYSGWPSGTGWKHSARLTTLGISVRSYLMKQETQP